MEYCLILTVAGKAAVVRSTIEGAVLVGVVLTVVRQRPCWLHVAAEAQTYCAYGHNLEEYHGSFCMQNAKSKQDAAILHDTRRTVNECDQYATPLEEWFNAPLATLVFSARAVDC